MQWDHTHTKTSQKTSHTLPTWVCSGISNVNIYILLNLPWHITENCSMISPFLFQYVSSRCSHVKSCKHNSMFCCMKCHFGLDDWYLCRYICSEVSDTALETCHLPLTLNVLSTGVEQGPFHLHPYTILMGSVPSCILILSEAWSSTFVFSQTPQAGCQKLVWKHFDGLVQNCSNSSVLAMELLQSCTKPSTCFS